MFALIKKTSGLLGIYAFGDILTRGVDFLLLLLYTRYLKPEEYGLIALFTLVSSILEALLGFGFTGAILRFYYQLSDDKERRNFYGAMWTFLLLVPLPVIGLLSQLGQPLFESWFQNIPFNPYIQLAIWMAYFNTAFTVLPAMLYRAKEKAGYYVTFNLIRSVVKILLITWFVVLQSQDAVGVTYAYIYSAIIIAIIASILLIKEVQPNLRWGQLKPALGYGIPLVPHFFAHWGLNISDRAILERFVGLNQVGVYSLGYQFGSTYSMLVTSCNNAVITMFSRAAKNKHVYEVLPQVVTYYVGFITYLALVSSLIAREIIINFTPASYHNASQVVPWIILAYWVMGLYYVPMNLLAMTEGKTKMVPIVTSCAAIINIGLNLLLIPRLSTIAIFVAAITTVIGYCALTIFMYITAQKQTRFQYEYTRLFKTVLVGILLYSIGRLCMVSTTWINMLIAIVISGLFPFILAVMGFWTPQELSVVSKLKPKISFQIT